MEEQIFGSATHLQKIYSLVIIDLCIVSWSTDGSRDSIPTFGTNSRRGQCVRNPKSVALQDVQYTVNHK